MDQNEVGLVVSTVRESLADVKLSQVALQTDMNYVKKSVDQLARDMKGYATRDDLRGVQREMTTFATKSEIKVMMGIVFMILSAIVAGYFASVQGM